MSLLARLVLQVETGSSLRRFQVKTGKFLATGVLIKYRNKSMTIRPGHFKFVYRDPRGPHKRSNPDRLPGKRDMSGRSAPHNASRFPCTSDRNREFVPRDNFRIFVRDNLCQLIAAKCMFTVNWKYGDAIK